MCRRCRKRKSTAHFWKDRSNTDGLQRWCKDCFRESMRKVRRRWAENPRTPPIEKYCPSCKTRKSSDQFHVRSYSSDGLSAWCRACDSTGQKKYARRKVLRRYGMDPEQYDRLMEQQGNRCPICERPFGSGRMPAIDHDHGSGRVRGLLCGECNLGLGKFRDDQAALKRAVEYLARSA